MRCEHCNGFHCPTEACTVYNYISPYAPRPGEVIDLTDPYGEKLIEEFEKDFEEDKDGLYR